MLRYQQKEIIKVKQEHHIKYLLLRDDTNIDTRPLASRKQYYTKGSKDPPLVVKTALQLLLLLLSIVTPPAFAGPITCTSSTTGDGGTGDGILVPNNQACTIIGPVTGEVVVKRGATVTVNNAEILSKIDCQQCKEVSVLDNAKVLGSILVDRARGTAGTHGMLKIEGSTVAGLIEVKGTRYFDVLIGGSGTTTIGALFAEGPRNGSLSITKTKVGGSVQVNEGRTFGVSLLNACGNEADDLDVIIGGTTGPVLKVEVNDCDFCKTAAPGSTPTGVGDLSLSNNRVILPTGEVDDIFVGGDGGCPLRIDSDVTIKENRANVILQNIDTEGDVEIALNKDVTLKGDLGGEDVSISNNDAVTAMVKNLGGVSLTENKAVDFKCTGTATEGNVVIENTKSGGVKIRTCRLDTLVCKDNGGGEVQCENTVETVVPDKDECPREDPCSLSTPP